MKKSRHLLLLVLLLTLVTGGVYAAWTYATKQAVDGNIGGNTVEIDKAEVVERGTIGLSSSNKAFSIKFDDVDFDHTVSLNQREVVITGSPVTVTFTVADGSNINLTKTNYHLNYQLKSDFRFDDKNVLEGKVVDLELTKSGAEGKEYTATISSTDLFNSLSAVNVELLTAEKHAEFLQALASANFSIVISDDAALAQK